MHCLLESVYQKFFHMNEKVFSSSIRMFFQLTFWIFPIKNISYSPCRHGSTAVFYEVPPPSPFFACLVSPHPWETTVGEGDSFWFLFGVERGKRKRSPLSSKGGGLSSSSSSSSPSVGLVFLFFLWDILLLFLLPLNIADRCPCQKRRRRWGGGKFNKQF